jgi:hypothetical protein
MNGEDIKYYISKGIKWFVDEANKSMDRWEMQARNRAANMDDDQLIDEYRILKNYEGDDIKLNLRKNSVENELKKRNF